jgi:hypothetical protein
MPAVTFTATGVPATPAQAASTTPAGQAGFEGNFAGSRPSVRIRDSRGQPVAGATVTFTVTGGNGTLAQASPLTDFRGDATLGSWRFGTGPQSVQAAIAGVAPIGFSATTGPAPASAYKIDVRFLAPEPTASQKAAFENAAAHWATILLGDLPDIQFDGSEDMSFCGGQQLTETIYDLLIFAKIEGLDGVGGVLGQAGACYVRDEGFLSVVGIMRFDAADVTALEGSGRFRDVVLHEMAHVIGLGSLWNFLELITGRGSGDPFFTGPSARAAFVGSQSPGAVFGGSAVPVEGAGGPGTRDVHWRESVLTNELMTGFLNAGPNPLSAITAASFRDEGYVVDDSKADVFSFTAALRAAAEAPIRLIEAPWLEPVRTVDRRGRLRRVLYLEAGPRRQ